MGIRGLSSYIQERSSKYLRDFELQNATVVIDGNNFVCNAYLECPHLNPCFGGDYNIFYNYLREIFALFKRCKIKPLILFDGGLDMGNRKYRQRLLRARQKVISSIKVKPSNEHRMRVFPVFFKAVFLDMLHELKIEVLQCNYEADQEITALARGLGCPVISNDSDFYVMDIPLIPLSSLELSGPVKNSEGFAVQCKIFRMELFLKHIGYANSSIFPLLGTLLGNDYVDARKFGNIYSHISIPKNKSMTEQHRKIAGLLEFLRGESVESAIDRILTYVKKDHRTEVEVAIRTSLKAYEDEGSQQELDFESLRDRIQAEMVEDGCPAWFARSYCQSRIQFWVTELMFCRKIPFHSQVESSHLPYTFNCTRRILQAIGLICLPTDEPTSIQFLSRSRSQLVFKKVVVDTSVMTLPLPKLPAVSVMEPAQRLALLLDVLVGADGDRLNRELPRRWLMVGAAIAYWARHSLVGVRSYHIDALVCTLLHLSVVEPYVGRIRSLKRLETARQKRVGDATALAYLTAVKSTFQFYNVDERMRTHDIAYDRDMVHTFGEFQAVLTFSQVLDSVLDAGAELPNVGTFYNGTFAYHAAITFRCSADRVQAAERLYGAGSPLLDQFLQLTNTLIDVSPPSLNDWTIQRFGASHPHRRAKKKEAATTSTVDVEAALSSDEISVHEDEDLHMLNNRFHLLKVK